MSYVEYIHAGRNSCNKSPELIITPIHPRNITRLRNHQLSLQKYHRMYMIVEKLIQLTYISKYSAYNFKTLENKEFYRIPVVIMRAIFLPTRCLSSFFCVDKKAVIGRTIYIRNLFGGSGRPWPDDENFIFRGNRSALRTTRTKHTVANCRPAKLLARVVLEQPPGCPLPSIISSNNRVGRRLDLAVIWTLKIESGFHWPSHVVCCVPFLRKVI